MIRTGEKRGDFQIKAEIGRGGMGTIFYAVDTMLNRDVALKVIHSDLARNVQLMERFKVEAMTQARMSHPNIVTVFSFHKIDDENVIAMEYVDGKNLKVLLREQKMLPITQAIDYLKQILHALEYSHSRNVIHRDIKPANILIDSDNRVKLSDFGIAKIFGKQGLTKTGMLLGTPWYTPPEQIMGENVDFRSDLYSVGVTFYEMVTGKVPFDSETNSDFQIQKAHLETPPPRPSVFNPEIGSRVEKFILKALQKKPEKRFQTAGEMLAEIQAIEDKIAETVVTSSGGNGLTKVRKEGGGHRNRKRLLVGIITVLFLCGAGIALYFFLSGDRGEGPGIGITADPSPVVQTGEAGKKEETLPDSAVTAEDPPAEAVTRTQTDKEPVSETPKKAAEANEKDRVKPYPRGEEQKTPVKKEAIQKSQEKIIVPEPVEKKDPDEVMGKPDDAGFEAELLRLRHLVEQMELKKAGEEISALLDSGHRNPGLYSLMGGIKFIQDDFPGAENFWKTAIEGGGSIAIRFFHKHGLFNKGCSGQIILKKGLIIYNSVSRSDHSFAVTSDHVSRVIKKRGSFGIEISYMVEGKESKDIFILRKKSRDGERFVSDFINKYILEVQ